MTPRLLIVLVALGAALSLAPACGDSTATFTATPDDAAAADAAQGSDSATDASLEVAVDAATDTVQDSVTVTDADAVPDTTPDVIADTTPVPDAVVDTTPDTVAGVACPPPAPTGFTVGERISDLAFVDCDGKAVSFHGACGAPATLIFNYYGW